MPNRTNTIVLILCGSIAIFIGGVGIGASAWFSQTRQGSSASPTPGELNAQFSPTGNLRPQPRVQELDTPVLSDAPQRTFPSASSHQHQARPIMEPETGSVGQQEAPSLPVSSQPSRDNAIPSQQSDGEPVICLDPGHPSEVGRGTRGKHITEIQAVWKVALKLQSLLQQEGMTVVMTKQSEEQFVRNEERANAANHANAALMVRLHCDSDAGSGVATYAPTRQGRNNGKIGPDRSVIAGSQHMAQVFHPAMMRSLAGSLPDRGLHSDTATQVGGKQGALTGSIYSHVPVLLVEMCVLTNPQDEAFIDNDQGQQKMAQAMADGVKAALQVRGK